MTDFVEQCRREWRRLGVPDPLAEEMAADLASDLSEAEAEGVSAEELLGNSSSDPRSFAASWAAERGIIPGPPSRNARRRPLVLMAFTAIAAIALIGAAALLLLTGEAQLTLVTSPAPQLPSHRAAATRRRRASRPHNKRIRPGRVDPAVSRDHCARLRRMAVVELEPLTATNRPRLAATSRGPAQGIAEQVALAAARILADALTRTGCRLAARTSQTVKRHSRTLAQGESFLSNY